MQRAKLGTKGRNVKAEEFCIIISVFIYPSVNIFRVVNSNIIRWVGYVARRG